MGRLRRVATQVRQTVRRSGYDVVRYPGIRHPHMRGQLIKRLGIDLVLDVGANVGQFGQDVRRFGYTGRLISYEPMQDAFAALSSAAADDPAWEVARSAVGAAADELDLHVAGNSVSSSLLPMLDRHAEVAPRSQYLGTEKVPVERLDVLAAQAIAEARSPFLKVDTQGYEAAVLDGAAGVLPELAAVELEMSLTPLYDGQALFQQLVERMVDWGFRLSVVSPGLCDPNSGETLQVDGIFERAT